MFTKRHYAVIARVLKSQMEEAIRTHDNSASLAVRRVAREFAFEFAADNSRFNSQSFYDAIGM